jgi:hypothetical protein
VRSFDGEHCMSIPGFTAKTAVEDSEKAEPKGAARSKYWICLGELGSGEIGLGDAIPRATWS